MDTVTARKAMMATINLLGEINVPMSMFDQIGLPLKSAINNIYIGLEALKEEIQRNAQETRAYLNTITC